MSIKVNGKYLLLNPILFIGGRCQILKMKNWIIIVLFSTFISCQALDEKSSDFESIIMTDTVFVSHKRYFLPEEAPDVFEYKIIHKSGTERWMLQRNVMIKDEKGSPVAIEGIVTDITDLKNSEETLRDSEMKLQAILDNHHQLTGLLDCTGKLLRANKTALEFINAEKS